MGLYSSLQTSQRLETTGIWLDLGHTRFRLSRAGGKNTKFVSAAEKVAREHKRALDQMGEEQGKKLFLKIYSEVIILDWLTKSENGNLDEFGEVTTDDHIGDRFIRGISGPNEEILEFNTENVIKTLDDLPDLMRIIKETAEDPALFRQELLKGIEGN